MSVSNLKLDYSIKIVLQYVKQPKHRLIIMDRIFLDYRKNNVDQIYKSDLI